MGRRDSWLIAFGLLAIAWSVRLAFLYSTPHHLWPYGCGFKGDALVFVRAAASGSLLDNGLPLRPPGMTFLLDLIWDRTAESFGWLRHCWILLGAMLAPLLYLSTRAGFGDRVAIIAGAIAAVATGPLLLSATLCNETPYLLLLVASAGWLSRLRTNGGWIGFAAWGVVQALACLLRSEHLMFGICGLVYAAWRPTTAPLRRVGLASAAVLAGALTLLPWHRTAWAAMHLINETPRAALPFGGSWSAEARARVMALPAFARASTIRLIQDTVRVRGGRQVEVADLGILEEAYDYTPRRLDPLPFVSIYGPLNFYLANHHDSDGGFSRAPLLATPPLRGGADRYPRGLVQALPSQLELSYPPHVRMLEQGFALGRDEIARDPLAWAGLVGRKLARMWSGAARGFGGYALPVGMSGVRPPVDFVIAQGVWPALFELLVLGACLAGVGLAWRRAALWPWLLLLATRVLTVALFFGYARQGALLLPVIAILLALVLDRCWSKVMLWCCVAVLTGLWVMEGVRLLNPPAVFVDGTELRGIDPFVRSDGAHRIEFR